jgi:hypothetical protein
MPRLPTKPASRRNTPVPRLRSTLSEHLEAFEAEAAARRSRTLLARLLAAWKGE